VAIHLSGPPGGGNREVAGRAAQAPCSTLLRVGFTEPTGLPRPLVRSYRTVSPLPVPNSAVGPSAVCSLWHCPAGRPDWPLTSTLPYGVPTFLDPILPDNHPSERSSRDHPADSPSCPWSHTWSIEVHSRSSERVMGVKPSVTKGS
jgi:hypothetical protein